MNQTTADKILTDMFESGWFHQDQIDYFEKEIINSLVSEPNRFWEKVNKSRNCWEWLGAKNTNGYGRFYDGDKMALAHRYSWELVNGSIPEGMYICHHCDNRSCVNPDHLFLGTAKDNMQDAERKGRIAHAKGEKIGSSKLTEEQVLNIRNEYQFLGENNSLVLAKEYGVSHVCILNIVNGISWKHLLPVEDEFRPFIIHHLGKDKYEIFPLETNEEIAKRLFEEWKEWFFDSGTKQIDLVTFIPWLSWKK